MSVIRAKVHFDHMKMTFELISPPDITEEEEGDKGQPQKWQHQGNEGAWPGGGGPGGPLSQQTAQQVTNIEHQEAANRHKIPEQGTPVI